ncbi:hypothetical protein HNP86_002011 [Methanococcus maripaludis]|uniref:RNA ligase n=1 Tax=Methanococcus maripaludis TaxID=39152 RepID=A0A7J9NVY8_METMI|nr:hypothetical protein [Methanococcus maripaludis]MBA2851852.1 hypothetical protein [Methanococcus maripaludis]
MEAIPYTWTAQIPNSDTDCVVIEKIDGSCLQILYKPSEGVVFANDVGILEISTESQFEVMYRYKNKNYKYLYDTLGVFARRTYDMDVDYISFLGYIYGGVDQTMLYSPASEYLVKDIVIVLVDGTRVLIPHGVMDTILDGMLPTSPVKFTGTYSECFDYVVNNYSKAQSKLYIDHYGVYKDIIDYVDNVVYGLEIRRLSSDSLYESELMFSAEESIVKPVTSVTKYPVAEGYQ